MCLSNNSDLDRVEGAEVMKDTAFHAGTALSISIYCGAQHLKTTNTSCLTQVLRARNLGVAQLAKIWFYFSWKTIQNKSVICGIFNCPVVLALITHKFSFPQQALRLCSCYQVKNVDFSRC